MKQKKTTQYSKKHIEKLKKESLFEWLLELKNSNIKLLVVFSLSDVAWGDRSFSVMSGIESKQRQTDTNQFQRKMDWCQE